MEYLLATRRQRRYPLPPVPLPMVQIEEPLPVLARMVVPVHMPPRELGGLMRSPSLLGMVLHKTADVPDVEHFAPLERAVHRSVPSVLASTEQVPPNLF